jgi:hypothetical protein
MRTVTLAAQVLLLAMLSPVLELIADHLDTRCCRHGICCCGPTSPPSSTLCLRTLCRCHGHQEGVSAAASASATPAPAAFALASPVWQRADAVSSQRRQHDGFFRKIDHPPPTC